MTGPQTTRQVLPSPGRGHAGTCLPLDGAGGPSGVPATAEPVGMLSQVTLTRRLPPPTFPLLTYPLLVLTLSLAVKSHG